MKVLVLDVGNSNLKCAVFKTNGTESRALGSEVLPTPRGHVWDMIDTARNMIGRAVKTHDPLVGIVLAFGDAFINCADKVPRYIFADEPTPTVSLATLTGPYSITGWPCDIEITGIHNLRYKHDLHWNQILPVNIFTINQLFNGTKPRFWDKTQASVSGEYNLADDNWLGDNNLPIREPSYLVDNPLLPIPFCIGGLDNAFIDVDDTTPYVIGGTWLVTGCVTDAPQTAFTGVRELYGVRGLRSATGNIHMQTVRRSSENRGSVDTAIEDLKVMGVEPDVPIRLIGGYANELAAKFKERDSNLLVHVPADPALYQLSQAAKYVYRAHADSEALAA